MADREDRDRKKFALLKTIFNARRQWQLMQQSILNHCIARWRLILKVCAFTLLLLSFHESKKDVVRSYRRLGRNEGWWNNVWNTYSERRFQKTFRISKDTFQFILSRIRHDLERDVVTEDPISPDMRLGMSLSSWTRWLLLYNSRMAGVGVSTVSTITQDVCEAIINNLWNESVACYFPKNEQEFKEKMLDMEEMWQFPCCWSAVDGCHIPTKCPLEDLSHPKNIATSRIFIRLY